MVLDKTGPVNYRIGLREGPEVHPVFRVSMLEPAKGDPPLAYDEDIQPENDLQEYEVEAILGQRKVRNQQQYLVKWLGYDTHR